MPKRIREITKTSIIDISRDLFVDDIRGMGVLSNCDRALVNELHSQLSGLWYVSKKL